MNHPLNQSKIQGSQLRVRVIRDLGFESFPASSRMEEVGYLEKQKSCLLRLLCYWSFSKKAEALWRMQKQSKLKWKEEKFHYSLHHNLGNWVTSFRQRKKGITAHSCAKKLCSLNPKIEWNYIRMREQPENKDAKASNETKCSISTVLIVKWLDL